MSASFIIIAVILKLVSVESLQEKVSGYLQENVVQKVTSNACWRMSNIPASKLACVSGSIKIQSKIRDAISDLCNEVEKDYGSAPYLLERMMLKVEGIVNATLDCGNRGSPEIPHVHPQIHHPHHNYNMDHHHYNSVPAPHENFDGVHAPPVHEHYSEYHEHQASRNAPPRDVDMNRWPPLHEHYDPKDNHYHTGNNHFHSQGEHYHTADKYDTDHSHGSRHAHQGNILNYGEVISKHYRDMHPRTSTIDGIKYEEPLTINIGKHGHYSHSAHINQAPHIHYDSGGGYDHPGGSYETIQGGDIPRQYAIRRIINNQTDYSNGTDYNEYSEPLSLEMMVSKNESSVHKKRTT